MSNKRQKKILKDKGELYKELGEALREFGKVKVPHLGIFEVKEITGRKRYDFDSGTTTDTETFNLISFKASKDFKRMLK